MQKIFYRIGNDKNRQGLWYDYMGNYTGRIHDEFSFCKSSVLPMPYDEEIRGWLSVTDTLESLYDWFSKEDILELQKHGYYITVYEATEYKEHKNHLVIKQDSSVIINTIILENETI